MIWCFDGGGYDLDDYELDDGDGAFWTTMELHTHSYLDCSGKAMVDGNDEASELEHNIRECWHTTVISGTSGAWRTDRGQSFRMHE